MCFNVQATFKDFVSIEAGIPSPTPLAFCCKMYKGSSPMAPIIYDANHQLYSSALILLFCGSSSTQIWIKIRVHSYNINIQIRKITAKITKSSKLITSSLAKAQNIHSANSITIDMKGTNPGT